MEYGETQMSVDWLESKIQNYLATYGSISPKMISIFAERAKAMHKEEHQQTYSEGLNYNQYQRDLEYGGAEYWIQEPKQFEQYYNETFGGNK